MSSTAHKTADEYREFFDSEEELAAKVEQLVAWLRESNSTLAFTGAGISTAAGVPDFRSGLDTTLDVGAGCWVARAAAKGELPDEVVQASAKKKRKPRKSTSTLQAIPTFTHMALVELQRAGLLSTLVSQNTDGLHRRSGFPVDAMAELHGNSNLEVCGLRTGKKNRGCGHAYMRDYRTRTARKVHDHRTGRRCTVDGCNGPLYDTIINFGEDLPERELEMGFDAAERADLCIAMGSSLRVTPAADMPQRVAERGKHLVVINLQSTPLDDVADLRINGKVDDVMKLVMERLGMDVPEFRLRRLVRVKVEQKSAPSKRVPGTEIVRNTVSIDGLDTDCQTPFSLFTRVLVDMPSQAKGKSKRARFDLNAEPYAVKARAHRDDLDGDERLMHVDLQFAGHYAEPPVALSLPCEPGSTVFMLEYDPFRRLWSEPVEVE